MRGAGQTDFSQFYYFMEHQKVDTIYIKRQLQCAAKAAVFSIIPKYNNGMVKSSSVTTIAAEKKNKIIDFERSIMLSFLVRVGSNFQCLLQYKKALVRIHEILTTKISH